MLKEINIDYNAIPKEKFKKYEQLLLDYMDRKLTRDQYIAKVEKLFGE